ncbi:hypothetical protein [Hypericibacter sp.]|uniref:hypothetical protein n=1 Tax=Hypericibacter sp. TaxID=2705401 RepID=UPI003D6CC6DB
MDEGPIKSVLDILPAYLNFFIGFLRSPRAAFAPYARTGRVHSDLTSFLLAGVGAAYLAGALMPIPGIDIQNPQGAMDEFAGWLSHQDVKALPLEALLVVLGVALAAHLIAKTFDRWQGATAKLASASTLAPAPNLAGTAEDSVNAALGFAAILLPLTTVLLLGMLSLATPALEARLGRTLLIAVIAGPLVLYMLVAIFYYLVMSFAAVHKVSWGRAAAALATAYVCIALIAVNLL